ncbi:MAG TPA: ribonuclease III [Bryobacteraceae bacterium]|nr:ribonuclease III [Bryobacteraceae bacterium]
MEEKLGYVFRDRSLLERALTHKSHVHERSHERSFVLAGDELAAERNGRLIPQDNEQLEFLGDAVLGFVVSDCLVRRFPDFPEGRLSKLKAHLVSATRLYEVAQELGLGEFLFLGRGEELSGGRAKRALLSDAVEALIAALYLDGGLDAVQNFIETRVIGSWLSTGPDQEAAVTDFKSALQEMAQALKLPAPRYSVVSESGPEHLKVFTVEVRLGKEWASQASGYSKKSAGQKAAQQVLQQLMAGKEAQGAVE